MRMLHKQFTIAVSCLALFLTMATPPMFADQAKTKKNSRPEDKAESAAAKAPVDLNTASEQELIDLPGIGPALAKKIIANRPYSSASELSKASVPERTVRKITPMVTTGPSSATASTSVPSSSKPASPSSDSNATSSAASSRPANKSAPSPQVTQAVGGGNGKVWVNTKSGVYHREGDEWYGKTKQGKYMTEDEAIKAGYRVDKADKKD